MKERARLIGPRQLNTDYLKQESASALGVAGIAELPVVLVPMEGMTIPGGVSERGAGAFADKEVNRDRLATKIAVQE